MNIKKLTYFVEVVKQKSFTTAAKSLQLSQSTLSKSIKDLEEELGLTLIDRSSKKIKTTYEGQLLYKKSIHFLENMNKEMNKIKNSLFMDKTEIIIGVPHVIGTTNFSSLIEEFKSLHPNIKLIFKEYETHDIKNKIKSGEIDMGVFFLSDDIEAYEDFSITTFFESDILCVVNEKHHLASRDKIVIEDLKNEPLIILDERYEIYNRIKYAFSKHNLTPNIIDTASQWDFLLEMVSINHGVSLLPKMFFEKFTFKNIKTIKILEANFKTTAAILILKDKHKTASINLFLDFFKKKNR